MLGFLSKIFGSKSDKDIKELQPLVTQVNEFFNQYATISHDELRNKTNEFRTRITEYVKDLDDEINSIKEEAEKDETPFDKKDDLYNEIDKLEKERDKKLEEVLIQILPEAFGVIKETARRFSQNETLTVKATDLDRDFATRKDFVTINGDKAIYKNEWTVAGIPTKWNMVHYDVQLIGGMVLHQGKISEMGTGEGKTLVSTLPAYLNSLPALGVHLVTVNDYLARRDCEWNGPLFNFLGITTDCIDYHQPHSPERIKAYLADITYGTNNEFGFDYLRDNMSRSREELVQRKLHYAMVDEVDSVLIDDARTPLIISGPVPKGEDQEFHNLKPRITKIYEAQKKVVNGFLNEAKKSIEIKKDGPKEGEGGLALLRASRGLPKNNSIIKYLSEEGNRAIMLKTEKYYMQDQSREMPKVDAELYFHIDEKNNSVELTDKGIELITADGEDKNFFLMPDVGAEIADIEKSDLNAEEKLSKKDLLLQDFSIKSERLHSVQQLLKAYALFEKDVEYVVMDGKVKIVDEQTGRILEGRRYSDGLHQAIEAKENVKVEAATQTFATVTLQNYFRMYHKLAGMTGTAETEAGEFWSIYKLDVVVIPTNRAIVRKDMEDFVFKTKREKYKAVIEEIEKLSNEGRPVLVGTTSVEVSELLARMLKLKNIKHNVLNAKQHQREAEIVAGAGLKSAVTIATNMAGRGTDIKLGPGVKEVGGLAIIGTERHEARRVDRQLRGRAGRQGDPGSTQFYCSLEDDLMRIFGSDRIAGLMDRMGYKEGEVIQHSMITKSIERAQKKVEENNFGTRKRLLEYDDVMNAQREVIYKRRRHALFGERLQFDLNNMLYDLCEELIALHQDNKDFQNFKLDCIRILSSDTQINEKEFESVKSNILAEKLYTEATEYYQRKSNHLVQSVYPNIKNLYENRGSTIENVVIPITDGIKAMQVIFNLKKAIEGRGKELIHAIEKGATLLIIDEAWKEHLRQMDELKQSVQSAVYEQKDPLLIYKLEAFDLFKTMVSEVNRDLLSFLFKGNLPQQQETTMNQAQAPPKTDYSRMKTGRDDTSAITNPNANQGRHLQSGENRNNQQEQVKQEPIRVGQKVGRNDSCPCGSGKKYKSCHGKDAA